MQAVILAAGKGMRLAPLTDTTPKALIDIGGKPLIQHTLEALPDVVREIHIVVGHLKDQIIRTIGHASKGRPIFYAEQKILDGTGSALHLLKDKLSGTFLVVNGDDLYAEADLERLAEHPAAILLSETKETIPNSALLNEEKQFVGIEADPPKAETKYRVCGAYVLDERFFFYPLSSVQVRGQREFSLPHTLVRMSADIPIKTEMTTAWQPVGTPEELAKARIKSRS